MRDVADDELTLPSVTAPQLSPGADDCLSLTILFHPDTSRIGERAELPPGTRSHTLGRRSIAFSRPGQPAATLDEPHISREAIEFRHRGTALQVSRSVGSSRLQVGESELQGQMVLDRASLERGVPLMLGHSVVLLLRHAPARGDLFIEGECGSLLGSSVAMCRLREQVLQAAASDLDVLLLGATGTGKELVARALHQGSRRAGGPLVVVNMAAIPEELAPAALFGTVRGAFTGADRSSPGYFQQADGGSLFLDEVGDTPPRVQPQLLRALQQREIQAVGGPVRRVDLRVISATDALLDAPQGHFKSALRYRLGACEINLPPLRERLEDVGELLLYFLRRRARADSCEQRLPGAHREPLVNAAWAQLLQRFAAYDWPGNVRELENYAGQLLLCDGKLPQLPTAMARALSSVDVAAVAPRRLRDIDDAVFERTMRDNDFEVARVARALQVSRAAVYRRIEASSGYRLVADIPPEEIVEVLSVHDGDSTAAARQLRVPAAALRNRVRRLPD